MIFEKIENMVEQDTHFVDAWPTDDKDELDMSTI